MDAITLGPLFIPLDRLIVVIALVVLFVVGYWLERRHKLLGAAGLWVTLGAGLAVGRGVYVAQYWGVYQAAPLETLYLWQGGYHVWSSLVAAVAVGTGWSLWRKQPATVYLAPVLSAAAVWWGLSLALSLGQAAEPERGLPDVLVSDLNGEGFSVADLRGRPTVINLWATWCGPCRREMPTFQRAEAEWPTVRFVYANQGEDASTVIRFLEEEALRLDTVILDRTASLMDAFDTRGMPTTVFFDAAGRQVAEHAGEVSAGRLQQYLSELNP